MTQDLQSGAQNDKEVCAVSDRPPAAIRFIGDLQRVEVQEGDFFVLSCNEELPQDTVERIHASFKSIAGDVPLLVLGKGMSLEVLDRTRALAKLDKLEDKARQH